MSNPENLAFCHQNLLNGDPQVRVFIFITWYEGEPAWTHALEGPHAFIYASETQIYFCYLVWLAEE